MPDHHQDAKELQRQMARLRGRIAIESELLTQQTQEAMSWRHQVASHPMAAAVAALAIGYWLVPSSRSSNPEQQLESTLNKLDQKLASMASGDTGKSNSASSSPLAAIGRTAAATLGSFLLRKLAGSVMQTATNSLQNHRPHELGRAQAGFAQPDRGDR